MRKNNFLSTSVEAFEGVITKAIAGQKDPLAQLKELFNLVKDQERVFKQDYTNRSPEKRPLI